MKILNYLSAMLSFLVLAYCTEKEGLPILGESSVEVGTGKMLHYTSPKFNLTNQLNQKVSSEEFEGKIQIVDFFFTSCPTICPQMTNHLKSVAEAFSDEDKVKIISFSIDPENDTPERLLDYSKLHDINLEKWTLLTGCKDIIFELAKDYKVRAFDGSDEREINLIHDGTFVLVDFRQRIRGYYNGLDEIDTERLISDVQKLLIE